MPKIAELLLNFTGPTPYLIVFGILLACGFGVPIPEDITLIAAGVLAYYQTVNVWYMIAVGLLGVMSGDGAMFWLGKRYGLTLAKKGLIAKVLTEERLQQVAKILHKRGNRILFAARFMPGLRSPLFFTAGALGVPARIFLFYDGMAALISVPAIVYSVYYFGHQMEEIILAIHKANRLVVIVIFSIVGIALLRWYRKSKRLKAANSVSNSLNDTAN